MGEKEPYDDPSETHGKCLECLDKQKIADEAVKKKGLKESHLSIKAILKREVIVLGIVLVVAFFNRNSTPATSFSSYSRSSKVSSYGNYDSNSVSMNYQLSLFWMIIYGYLIYLFFRIFFLMIKQLQQRRRMIEILRENK